MSTIHFRSLMALTVSCLLFCGAASAQSVVEGNGATADGPSSVAIGEDAKASGDSSNAIGHDAEASGGSCNAIGNNAKATGGEPGSLTGGNCTAIGTNAQATQYSTTAIGTGAQATNVSANAFGANAQASGNSSNAIGTDAKASATLATAIGGGANASGYSSTAIGTLSNASGSTSIAVGHGAKASAGSSVAIGTAAEATHESSVAIGAGTKTTAANQVAVGGRQITQVKDGQIAQGSKDAINGGQLWDAMQNMGGGNSFDETMWNDRWTVVNNRLGDIDGRLITLNKRLDSVGAQSAALAMMNGANANLPIGKIALNVAWGQYRSTAAFAVGAKVRLTERSAMSFGVSYSRGNAMGGIGYSLVLN